MRADSSAESSACATFTVPPTDEAAVSDAAAAASKAGKKRPAVQAAIDAIRASATLAIDDALADERAVFQRLRVSREAAALRHQFFAERDSAKHPSLDAVAPRTVQRVAVIGAGTMGSGIAIAALDAGLRGAAARTGRRGARARNARIRDHYAGRVRAGKMKANVAEACEARLRSSLDWNELATADLVIEAVFEEIGVKRQVFQRIDAVAKPGAVLASNTSYLDLDAIADATSRPQDVIGLHFFSPANVMRLMEVVRGRASAPDAVATGLALGRKLKKLPLLTGNAFGFVGNRLYAAYRRQCEFMVEEGAWPEQVDAALERFGFAMGPFAVADLSGLDIAWRMRQAQAATRDPSARYVQIADRLCEAGRLGRKTGRRLLPLRRRWQAAGRSGGARADRAGSRRQGHRAAPHRRRRRSAAASCWRWSTKPRCCSPKALPSGPPTWTSRWSTAMASRAGKAGRCSGPASAATRR